MNRFFDRIFLILYYLTTYWYYKIIFGELGSRTVIKSTGSRIENPKNIFIGSKVFIGRYSWLAASPHVSKTPKLIIKDNVSIGRFNQVYSNSEITIENSVLTADRVYISDGTHESKDIDIPIMSQGISSRGPMTIGAGSWIGINACIIGASIGKNCVIAANSVVVKDIPDYCIVGGVPARIIKRYNLKSKNWEQTHEDGSFKF